MWFANKFVSCDRWEIQYYTAPTEMVLGVDYEHKIFAPSFCRKCS